MGEAFCGHTFNLDGPPPFFAVPGLCGSLALVPLATLFRLGGRSASFRPVRVPSTWTPDCCQSVVLPAVLWVTTLMRCDNDLGVVFVENPSWIIRIKHLPADAISV